MVKQFGPLTIKDLCLRRSSNFELVIDKLVLKKGSLTCLAGANGSGKTSLLEVVAGLISPDTGTVRLSGHDPFKDNLAAKLSFGFVPDDEGWIIAELTAREFFKLLSSIYAKAGLAHSFYEAASHLSNRLHFNSLDQQLGSLSHGNRKKVQLIAALSHKPPLLVVDELRNGLDPIAGKIAEELLSEQAREGTAILAATHDLWWADRLSDEVVILSRGRVVLSEPTTTVKAVSGSLESRFMELYAA